MIDCAFPTRRITWRRRVSIAARWAALSGACALALCGCLHRREPISRETPHPAPAPAPPAPGPAPRLEPVAGDTFTVRVQYLQTTQEQEVVASGQLLVTSHELGLKRLPAGTWRVSAKATGKTTFEYPVFVKSFVHNETGLLRAAMDTWRGRGYSPSVTTMGRMVTGGDGVSHDNRLYWLAVKRCASQSEADALKKKLQGEKVWAWSREEVAEAAPATVVLRSTTDQTVVQAKAPVTLRSDSPIALPDARKGQPPVEVPGPITVFVDRTGNTAFHGELSLEEYIRGILPAEMYASWPLEALKAQAVAARSEVIVHTAGKHYFDGYDFCIEQHCRAFGGRKLCDRRTDQAVAETAGVILVAADQSIVPTVFSSNCGGWTESNENVWDGDAEPALRGRPDRDAEPERRAAMGTNNADRWLNSAAPSYCAGDKEYYRWTRSISLAKLSAQFNRDFGIGNLKAIEPLERGVSGRLKSVRLVGDRKNATIEKELNIRRAFENLPSALCTFSIQKGQVLVKGAGRGHGVGLCQHGAYGMAQANFPYEAILRHYFSGVTLGRL